MRLELQFTAHGTDAAPREPERRSDLELSVGSDAEDLHKLARHAPCWFEGVAGQSDARADSFGFDVLACPRCGQAMRLIALIEQLEVIRRILRHLGQPLDVAPRAPARAPPFHGDADAAPSALGSPFADEGEWTSAEGESC